MILPPDVPRCIDAEIYDCPQRDECVRWTLRDSAGPRVVWVGFAQLRDWSGCRYVLSEDDLRRRMH